MSIIGNGATMHSYKNNTMEIQTAHYKTRRWLFHFVDKILRNNGFYTIHYDPEIGYTVEYRCPDDPDAIYKVVKGQDEKGFAFYIKTDIDEECMLYLKQGDVLLFELEYEDTVWFTCTTMLIGAKLMDTDYGLGATHYGSISTMISEGLIEKAVVL